MDGSPGEIMNGTKMIVIAGLLALIPGQRYEIAEKVAIIQWETA
jgi:hypothetical protein